MFRTLWICVLLVALSACQSITTKDDSLYLALGGKSGITKIVDIFIYEIGETEQVLHHFEDTNLDRFREKQIEHLCLLSGGPCIYTGDEMIPVHEGMNISAYFNAEGSFEKPFKAVKTDFYIHNSRGEDQVWLGTRSRETSMAHLQVNVSKKEDYLAAGQTALAIDIQNFEADIDFENFTLGTFEGKDGRGIGDIYFTDLQIRAETVVYGH